MKPKWQSPLKIDVPEFDLKKFGASNLVDGAPVPGSGEAVVHKFDQTPMIDRTYKMYYAGAQKRPDGNYCRPIFDSNQKVKFTFFSKTAIFEDPKFFIFSKIEIF